MYDEIFNDRFIVNFLEDVPVLEMHDEIFHFEIFKNFMEILKYFKKFLIFTIKWLKTFKSMINAYEVSRKFLKYFRNISRNISWNISKTSQWTMGA